MIRVAGYVFLASFCCAQEPTAQQLFNHALEAQKRGDVAGAMDGYERALKIAPGLVPARINLATALVRLGRLDEAIDQYRAVLRSSPSNPRIATLLANCLVLRGKYADAIEILKPIEKAHPNDLDAVFVLGEALISTDKSAEGLERVERVAAARSDADAWMLAGMTHLRLGEPAKARDNLDKALRVNPALPGAYTLSGMAKSRAGDEDGAALAYRKALDLDPNDFEANLRLGAALRHKGDLAAAKRYLGAAVRLDASSILARHQMAQLNITEGRDAEAAADLEAIIGHAPNLLQPHVQLAAIYYRLHRPEDGLRERKIVDRLMAEPDKQDHILDADPSLATEPPP
jgi:tetratricopeptide (TPR) repeat protein